MIENDKAAWELAIEMTRAESEGRASQIGQMLVTRDRADVGRFASYHCQMRALRLKPWEEPPCHLVDLDYDHEAAELLRQMLALGVSRWHPDPIKAVEEAERQRVKS